MLRFRKKRKATLFLAFMIAIFVSSIVNSTYSDYLHRFSHENGIKLTEAFSQSSVRRHSSSHRSQHDHPDRPHGTLSALSLNQRLEVVPAKLKGTRKHESGYHKNTWSGDGGDKILEAHSVPDVTPQRANNWTVRLQKNRSTVRTNKHFCKGASGLTLFHRSHERTALASFPGSGNSWVRDMLQQISGKHTGSYYFDASLAIQGFPGERVCADSPSQCLVEKTHEHTDLMMALYTKAVLLLRNPFEAIISYFHYHSGFGHTGQADPSLFKTPNWESFVREAARNWFEFYCSWMTKYNGSLFVVFYENLKVNLTKEMGKLSTFLNLPFGNNEQKCLQSLMVNSVVKRRHSYQTVLNELYFNDSTYLINNYTTNLSTCMQEKCINCQQKLLLFKILNH